MGRAIAELVAAVDDRSGGRCEAVWHPGYRCPNRADALHHRLPRARARVGDEHLLDLAGDAENIAHLCRPCHDAEPHRARFAALVGPFGSHALWALRTGIVIDGEISTAPNGDATTGPRLVYRGTSIEYADRYPPLEVDR